MMVSAAMVLFQVFLPMVTVPPPFNGPGVAGGISDWRMGEIGITWDYSWDECHGVNRCLPMWRPGAPDVNTLMHSCGSRLCIGLMILNEPGWGDNCHADCQAQALHDRALEAKAANPKAAIVFGNYVFADTQPLMNLAATWMRFYPDSDLGQFLREHDVRIGVHHYGWADYDRGLWRQELLGFRAEVTARWGVPIVLTEYGSLEDGDRWKQVVGDQARWLLGQNIMAAPWVAGYAVPEDARFGCCPMWDDTGLTEYGRLYAGLIERWDR